MAGQQNYCRALSLGVVFATLACGTKTVDKRVSPGAASQQADSQAADKSSKSSQSGDGSDENSADPALKSENDKEKAVYFDPHIKSQVESHCLPCHSKAKRSGGMSLERYIDPELTLTSKELWSRATKSVLGKQGVSKMPPKGSLGDEEKKIWKAWRDAGYPRTSPDVEDDTTVVSDNFASGLQLLSSYQKKRTLKNVFANTRGIGTLLFGQLPGRLDLQHGLA